MRPQTLHRIPNRTVPGPDAASTYPSPDPPAQPPQEVRKAVALVESAGQGAPWAATDAYVSTVREGRGNLTLNGAGDPTGRGLGYSFTRDIRRVGGMRRSDVYIQASGSAHGGAGGAAYRAASLVCSCASSVPVCIIAPLQHTADHLDPRGAERAITVRGNPLWLIAPVFSPHTTRNLHILTNHVMAPRSTRWSISGRAAGSGPSQARAPICGACPWTTLGGSCWQWALPRRRSHVGLVMWLLCDASNEPVHY